MEETYFLLEPEAIELLSSFDIPYPEYGVARNEQEAVRIADSLGYPVVLKIVSPQVVHKSDVGGVKINLRDAQEVKEAFWSILQSVKDNYPHAYIEGMLVAQQAPRGQEIIIGMSEDEIFGKTLMFGIGGILTELIRDVTFKVCPIDRKNAEIMVREIKGSKLLTGFRGSARLDTDALVDLLIKVSELVMEDKDIQGLDLNPVMIYEKGLLVLDARIMKRIQE